jgi:5'-methylthioadenosine phosphorylase
LNPQDPVGLIVGTSLLDSGAFEGLEPMTVDTRWEPVTLHEAQGLVAIQRHDSPDGYRPPHKINHRANFQALRQVGVDRVFSVQSTGSLTESIPPGHFVVPHDFMNPWTVVSYFDDERAHGVSGFDEELRTQLLNALSATGEPVVEEGVYVQTLGPRFETPAEAQLLAGYGEIVGMTAASELTIACELDMRYVSLCSVDNYVNGIADTHVSMDSFQESVAEQLPTVKKMVRKILKDVFELKEVFEP